MKFFNRNQEMFLKHSRNYVEKIFIWLQIKKTFFELGTPQKGAH